MITDPGPLSAPALIRHGFSKLTDPPFRTLWLLTLLIAAASTSLGGTRDDFSLAAVLLFALVTFLLEMAAVLAAGRSDPDPSADVWIRGALRRRRFWRFVLAGVLTDLAVGVGMLLLIVGGLIVAGMVGLAPQAALLEGKLPLQALGRSAELTRPARMRIAAVYGLLVLVPTLISVAPLLTGVKLDGPVQVAIALMANTMALAALIALTRAFIDLGGTPTPAPDALAAPAEPVPPQ